MSPTDFMIGAALFMSVAVGMAAVFIYSRLRDPSSRIDPKYCWGVFSFACVIAWIPAMMFTTRHNGSLERAVISGSVEGVREAIEAGADPNMRIRPDSTILHTVALYGGSVEMARYLIEHGSDPHARDSNGYTPCDIARQRNDTDLFAYLSAVLKQARTPEP